MGPAENSPLTVNVNVLAILPPFFTSSALSAGHAAVMFDCAGVRAEVTTMVFPAQSADVLAASRVGLVT